MEQLPQVNENHTLKCMICSKPLGFVELPKGEEPKNNLLCDSNLCLQEFEIQKENAN